MIATKKKFLSKLMTRVRMDLLGLDQGLDLGQINVVGKTIAIRQQ